MKSKNTEILKKLKKVDKDLIKVDKKLSILKIFTPKNIEQEKQKFIESEWKYIPNLKYNKLNIDLEETKKIVSSIKIPKCDLENIFKRKKQEILDKISFLEAFVKQDTKNLNKYSEKLHWKINKENLDYATNLIKNKAPIYQEERYLNVDDIREIVWEYNKIYWLKLVVKWKNIVSRCMIVNDTLFVKNNSLIWKKEIRSIIAHEIEWHHLRKKNSRLHKFEIFSFWTAWYIDVEEWIATYNQDPFLDKNDEKYYFNAERYYFINYWLTHSYTELIDEMKNYYKNDYSKIFDSLVRYKRWIKDPRKKYFYTKDIIYLNWYLEILDFIKKWWNILELFFWKISLSDLDEIKNSKLLKFEINKFIIPNFYK